MGPLLQVGLSNCVMALALAAVAASAGRWCRRPAVAHGLWLLVLLKLVTPPLVPVPVPWPEPEEPATPITAAALPESPLPQAPALDPGPAPAVLALPVPPEQARGGPEVVPEDAVLPPPREHAPAAAEPPAG